MNRNHFRVGHVMAVLAFIAPTPLMGCDRQSDQSGPVAATNLTSASPSSGKFLSGTDWKREAFGELEFIVISNANVVEARFRKVQPDPGVQLTLGTKTVIPVLSVLKDETLDYPETFAIVRVGGKLSAVSETGRVAADLSSIMISPSTVSRIHEVFSNAIPVEQKIDEGMYEGIIVIFPASCLPLRTLDEVKSHLRGVLIELILDKVRRMTGKDSNTFEARFHAWSVRESQRMFFLVKFPLFVCKDADDSIDLLKVMQLMIDPAEARKAQENAEYLPLKYEGEAGRVVAVDTDEAGIRLVIQTGAADQPHSIEYGGVLETDLKVGDSVQPKQLIGMVKNPRSTPR